MFGPLIDVDELAARIGDARLRIADVRWYLTDPAQGAREYLDGHIPGAFYVDLNRDLSASEGPGRHPLPRPAEFTETLGRLGISPDDEIVVYDSSGGSIAARMWWMLHSISHRSVAILDGGFPAWVEAGLFVSLDPVIPEPTYYPPAELWPGIVDIEDVRRFVGYRTLIDARASERYLGEIEPVDPRAGHIPSALSLPYTGNLDEHGRMLAPGQLRSRLAVLTEDSVVYCGSGVSACHHLLAAAVAGIPAPLLYPGSWSDWSSRSDTDVATGPQP